MGKFAETTGQFNRNDWVVFQQEDNGELRVASYNTYLLSKVLLDFVK